MSCFFCDSNYHLSQFCEKYVSDESRKGIVAAKNCCCNCLVSKNEFVHLGEENCKNSLKCYICFSRKHNTVYCPDRFIDPYMFPPNIDEDLFSRFDKFLTSTEKCEILFSFQNILKLQTFKVKYLTDKVFPDFECLLNFTVVVSDNAVIGNEFESCFTENSILSPPIFYIKRIELYRNEFLSHDILLLLSSKTKIFKCGNTKFRPKLEFSEILEKAQHLEEISIDQTNIQVNNTWPNDILLFNKSKHLLNFIFSVADYSFDAQNLVYLLKKKRIKIVLKIHYNEIVKNGRKKFLENFMEISLNTQAFRNTGFGCLKIYTTYGKENYCTQYYIPIIKKVYVRC